MKKTCTRIQSQYIIISRISITINGPNLYNNVCHAELYGDLSTPSRPILFFSTIYLVLPVAPGGNLRLVVFVVGERSWVLHRRIIVKSAVWQPDLDEVPYLIVFYCLVLIYSRAFSGARASGFAKGMTAWPLGRTQSYLRCEVEM